VRLHSQSNNKATKQHNNNPKKNVKFQNFTSNVGAATVEVDRRGAGGGAQ